MNYESIEPVHNTAFEDYETSTRLLLDKLGLKERIKDEEKIIVKPNLVSNAPPPITTDVRFMEAICRYCLKHSKARVIVAEGSAGCDASLPFEEQGYYKTLKPLGVEVIDIDKEQDIELLENPDMPLFKKVHLPRVILDGFLISAAVLKDHTICTTTLSIKNLIGFLPAEHYKGFWRFRKSKAHRYNIHQAAADVATYRKVDLAMIDGSIGLKRGHLFGKPFDPPKKILLASLDALAADMAGSEILGHSPAKIKHLRCFLNNKNKGLLDKRNKASSK